MAIIYSYPSTDPQSSDLLVITRQPSDPDETANYSVSVNKLSNLIIANLVNGTDNYIPKFDGTNSLVNSLFYETDTGRVGLGTTTPSRKLQVAGDAIIDTDLEVDGGLDVAGTVRLGFTGNDPVILGNPTGKRTEWNNPGYFEIYAENPDSPGDFNETVDIDGEFLGGGFVGVYPVRTENRHGIRIHSRNATGTEANYIDIASVESAAVRKEDIIRLIDINTGSDVYAGIKISHPTDNRFRFNSEFNTEPTVPFLVNSSSKFAEDLTISSDTTADKKLIIGNDNGAQTTNNYSILDITGKSSVTGTAQGAKINLNANGDGVARVNFNSSYDFTSTDSYRNAFVGYPGGNNDHFYIRQSQTATPTNYAGFVITSSHVKLQGDGIRIGADSTANQLDDYEEGTFTPTIGSYFGGSLTPVYNAQLGEYTKIGNIVTASLYFSLDTTTTFSGTGDLIFDGLPFTVKDQSSSPLQIVSQVSGTLSYFCKFDDATMGKFVGAGRSVTSTSVCLYKAVQIGSSPPDDKSIPITTADLVNTGSFYGDYVIAFTITYRTEQ